MEKPFIDIDEMEKLLVKALDIGAETRKSILAEPGLTFIVGETAKMQNLIFAAQKIAKKKLLF
jgi:DNA-binding NtrC family response regulator